MMDALQISRFNLVLTCIKNIESFDGSDANQLPDYINQVENILPSYEEFDNNSKQIMFGYIKNKCVGKTREAIHRYANVTTWPVLKDILTKNFGEKYSSNDLMDDLKTCTLQGTVENYYFKINKLANRIHNRNLTHGDNVYTTDEVNRIALKTFRDHLPEPTRTMIFSRDPRTLEDAFKIILEARHQHYTQFGPAKRDYMNTNIRRNFRDNFNNPNNFDHQRQLSFNNSSNRPNRTNLQVSVGQQVTPYQNKQFPNPNLYHNNPSNSNSTGQTRRSHFSQTSNRNYQQFIPDTRSYQTRQPVLNNQNANSFNNINQQFEPMEIGNSNVNFPIADEQNFLT